jgi:hypothetical protein
MARLGQMASPGVKHNPYATISINRPTVADNGGLLFPGSSSFTFNSSRGEYYTDQFTITVNARAYGEDLYYQIQGPGAVEARFYQSGRATQYLPTYYNTHYDGSAATATGSILVGRLGRVSSVGNFTKCVYANTTTSNTNDSATTTSFYITVRLRNGLSGAVIATSSSVTCYIFRFVIDIFNEGTGNYQNASYTIPGEFTTAGTTSRNFYARLQLPSATIYNNQNLFSSPNWVIQTTAPSTGTAATIGSDIASSMSWNGVWNDGPTYNYHWFASAVYKDNATEAIEYFRLQLQYTSQLGISPGVPWTQSQNHAIVANTS